MKKQIAVAVAIIAAMAYDFYRGYQHTGSVLEGLFWVIGGLIVLAILWGLYSLRSKPN